MTDKKTEMSTLPFRFKWVSASPDSQNKTMRNNLEPEDVFVQVNVPLKAIFIANAEDVIKFQLGTDKEIVKEPKPILSPAGLAEAHRLLSEAFLLEPKEKVEDEEWDDSESSEDKSDDKGWEDEDSNDDDTWEDE